LFVDPASTEVIFTHQPQILERLVYTWNRQIVFNVLIFLKKGSNHQMRTCKGNSWMDQSISKTGFFWFFDNYHWWE
jgi:hypothetical protein